MKEQNGRAKTIKLLGMAQRHGSDGSNCEFKPQIYKKKKKKKKLLGIKRKHKCKF
jgi:hypothetical protein